MKIITAKSITEAEISCLRDEAVQAGDSVQVAMCDLAIDGGSLSVDDYTTIDIRDWKRHNLGSMTQAEAVQACVDAINDGVQS